MKNRRTWTDSEIAEAILLVSKKYGRMASVSEMRKEGLNALSLVLCRRGGIRTWASRLGLTLKGSETKLGQDFEISEIDFFKSLGFKVERQSCKKEFDLLVNGYRVDVKVANLYECKAWQGYSFAGMKRGAACDFFDCLILDNRKVKHRLLIPSEEVPMVTLTMTVAGVENKKHWAMKFKDATRLLSK